jgi:hypothetical protein
MLTRRAANASFLKGLDVLILHAKDTNYALNMN